MNRQPSLDDADTDVAWLQPYPTDPNHAQPDHLSLACISSLQLLTPEHRAAVALCEAANIDRQDAAKLLGLSVDVVDEILRKPRAEPEENRTARDRALVAKLGDAFSQGRLDALRDIFADDVVYAIPSIPIKYRGRQTVTHIFDVTFALGRRLNPIASLANGQIAFSENVTEIDNAISHATGLLVVTMNGDRVSALTRFDSSTLPKFGIPRRF